MCQLIVPPTVQVDTLSDITHVPATRSLDGLGLGWAVVRVRLKKAHLLMGPIYLTSGDGFKGSNADRRHQLSQCLTYYDASHHIIGDLNEEPQDWPAAFGQRDGYSHSPPQGHNMDL